MRRFTICSILLLLMTIGVSAQDTPIEITADNVTQLELLGYLGRGTLGKIAWTADGQWLAVATSMGIELYAYDDMTAPPVYADVPDDFTLLATHPIENWLVGHNNNFDIIYWDIATHQITATIQLTEDIDNIQKLVFDDTGTRFAIDIAREYSPGAGVVYIWDIQDISNPILLVKNYSLHTNDIFFVDDSVFILNWGFPSLINLADPDNIQSGNRMLGSHNSIIHPQKTMFLDATLGSLVLWDVRDEISGYPSLSKDYTQIEIRASDAAYSADGRFLATTIIISNVAIYNTETFEKLWEFTGFSSESSLSMEHFAPHPIDNFLVFRDQNSLYTYGFDEQPPQLLMDDYDITPAVVSADGTLLTSVDGWGRISVWDVLSKEKRMTLYTGVTGVFFTLDNHLLLLSEGGKYITLWDTATQQIIKEVEIDMPYFSMQPQLSPDGRWLAIRNLLFDTSTLEWRKDFDDALHRQYIHGGEIWNFTPDGEYIFYWFNNQTMFILRSRDGEIVGVMEELGNDTFYRQKWYFCEQKQEKNIYSSTILDLSKHIIEFPSTNYWIVPTRLDFNGLSPDCTRLIFAQDSIKIFDALTDELINTVEWNDNEKSRSTFLHNDTLAMVTQENQTLFLDAQTGQLVHELPISFKSWYSPNPNANPQYYVFNGNEVWGILPQTDILKN